MLQETGPLQGLSAQFMRQLKVHSAELATAWCAGRSLLHRRHL